jgi:NADH pyrophosphatase NudC (nudix superfamily)
MRPDPPTNSSPDPLAAASAAPHKRGALRRRLRKLRRARTEQLTALGTLVVDARKRSNGSQPAVVGKRAAEVAELDREVRELAHAVDPHGDARELASGIAGGCRECGELLATDDRFCPACGTPAKPGPTDAATEASTPEAAGPPASAPLPPATPPPAT